MIKVIGVRFRKAGRYITSIRRRWKSRWAIM